MAVDTCYCVPAYIMVYQFKSFRELSCFESLVQEKVKLYYSVTKYKVLMAVRTTYRISIQLLIFSIQKTSENSPNQICTLFTFYRLYRIIVVCIQFIKSCYCFYVKL